MNVIESNAEMINTFFHIKKSYNWYHVLSLELSLDQDSLDFLA